MKNPVDKLELKSWPDILLAIFAIPFVVSFGAMFPESTRVFATPLALITAGVLSFGFAGKLSYYRACDKTVKGNANAWFPAWRSSVLSNCFVLISIGSILIGFVLIWTI